MSSPTTFSPSDPMRGAKVSKLLMECYEDRSEVTLRFYNGARSRGIVKGLSPYAVTISNRGGSHTFALFEITQIKTKKGWFRWARK